VGADGAISAVTRVWVVGSNTSGVVAARASQARCGRTGASDAGAVMVGCIVEVTVLVVF
jgi:hypothetical protein